MCRKESCNVPAPDERPRADVVIYDGRCRLCCTAVRWLHRRDRRDRLTFLPLQDPRATERYPDLSLEELEKHVYVVDRHGRRHKGAGAVRYLSRRLPALWIFCPLLHLPGSMPVWRWLYSQISRRRHMFDRSE